LLIAVNASWFISVEWTTDDLWVANAKAIVTRVVLGICISMGGGGCEVTGMMMVMVKQEAR
jgi:hypothetical protein